MAWGGWERRGREIGGGICEYVGVGNRVGEGGVGQAR